MNITLYQLRRRMRNVWFGVLHVVLLIEISGKVQENAGVAKLIDLGAGDELVWKVYIKENQVEVTVSSKR
jgi:hypothetical protein